MQLYDWMKARRLPARWLVAELGARGQVVAPVSAWRYSRRRGHAQFKIPPPRLMPLIVDITGGEVTPADYYAMPEAGAGAQSPDTRPDQAPPASGATDGAA